MPLAGLAVKVTPGFDMIGLSNLDADKERNFQLLRERAWFDIPAVYNINGLRKAAGLFRHRPGTRR